MLVVAKMPLIDYYSSKLLYGALFVGAIVILAHSCDGCSCRCRGMERFRPRDASRYETIEPEAAVKESSLEEMLEYS